MKTRKNDKSFLVSQKPKVSGKIILFILAMVVLVLPVYAIDVNQCWYHRPSSATQGEGTTLRIWANHVGDCYGIRTDCSVTWSTRTPSQQWITIEQDTIHELYAGGASDSAAFFLPDTDGRLQKAAAGFISGYSLAGRGDSGSFAREPGRLHGSRLVYQV